MALCRIVSFVMMSKFVNFHNICFYSFIFIDKLKVCDLKLSKLGKRVKVQMSRLQVIKCNIDESALPQVIHV